MGNVFYTSLCIHWLSCSEVLRATVTFVCEQEPSPRDTQPELPVLNIQLSQRHLCEWACGKSESRERWTKPRAYFCSCLNQPEQCNTQNIRMLYLLERLSSSWIICLHWGVHRSSAAVRVYGERSPAATGTSTAKQLSAQLFQGNSH